MKFPLVEIETYFTMGFVLCADVEIMPIFNNDKSTSEQKYFLL